MGKSSKNPSVGRDEAGLARLVVSSLVRKGVKLLALDFDKTIVSVHTAGFWRQGTPKLAEHVRSCFKALIKAALESSLNICIVTYSMQPQLIQDVLKHVLPASNTAEITIRASSKDWLPPSNPSSQVLGKQQHLAWMVTQLFNKRHLIIQPHEIFLIDDDEENVDIAKQFGHLAYKVPDEVTMQNIWEFVERMDLVRVSRSRSFVAMKKTAMEGGGRDTRSYAGEGYGSRDSRMQAAANGKYPHQAEASRPMSRSRSAEIDRGRGSKREGLGCTCESSRIHPTGTDRGSKRSSSKGEKAKYRS